MALAKHGDGRANATSMMMSRVPAGSGVRACVNDADGRRWSAQARAILR